MHTHSHMDHAGFRFYDGIAVHARPLREYDELLPRLEHTHALLEGINVPLAALDEDRPGFFHEPAENIVFDSALAR